jgi:hypothetical protein
MYLGRNGVCTGNAEITAVCEIYNVCISVCFVSEGHHQTTVCCHWSSCELKELYRCCLVVN